MPAEYMNDYNNMVSASETAGTAFLAKYSQESSSYYWNSCLTPMLWYQDPNRIGMICDSYNLGLSISAIENEMRTFGYAVISDSARRVYFFYSGNDLFEGLPVLERSGNLYYHDGHLIILVIQGGQEPVENHAASSALPELAFEFQPPSQNHISVPGSRVDEGNRHRTGVWIYPL
jgi:hypothetical protein